jgi:hypothetical protein
LGPRGLS